MKPADNSPAVAAESLSAPTQRIADPSTGPRLSAVKKKLQDPAEALKFLRKIGLVDQNGALTKRFGG